MKKTIDLIFEDAKDQNEAMEKLYRLAFPKWDAIKKIEGWPGCGEKMWHYVCEKFIKLDKEFHPEVIASGGWMNKGFSCRKELGPWEIDCQRTEVTYNLALLLKAA